MLPPPPPPPPQDNRNIVGADAVPKLADFLPPQLEKVSLSG